MFLTSKSFLNFQIAWKSNEIDHFMILKPYSLLLTEDDEEVYEFIADVLTDSLKNRHIGIDKTYQLSLDINQVDIYQIADHRGLNLLLIAKQAENINLITKFESLKLYLLDQDRGSHLQTTAIKYGHYDAVLALYGQDIPIKLTEDTETCSEELVFFFQKLDDFNKAIKSGEMDKVIEVFHQLPVSSYCYNLKNESALNVATQCKTWKPYEFLWSKGIRFAPHESPLQIFNNVVFEQDMVRKIYIKYAHKSHKQHISILMSKTALFNDTEDCEYKLKLIRKAYKILSFNIFIKPLLEVIAESRHVKINFDFNKDAGSSNSCRVSKITGRIYIGAKQMLTEATKLETYGILAHELCHIALDLVYKNKGKPYSVGDQKTMKEFAEMSKTSKASKNAQHIIRNAFDSCNQDAELIGCLIHVLALYQKDPEKLIELKNNFGELLKFYNKKIMPELKQALPEIRKRAAVDYQELYKYYELSTEDMAKVQSAVVIYKDVKVQFKDLYPENRQVYRDLTVDHLLYLMDGLTLNLSDPYLSYLNDQVRHSWENLAETLKDKVLESKLYFQNESLLFSELYIKCPKSFETLTSCQIGDVLDGIELNLYPIPMNQTSFYIEREFLCDSTWMDGKGCVRSSRCDDGNQESQEQLAAVVHNAKSSEKNFYFEQQNCKNKVHNFDDILDVTEHSRMFVLSSKAGTGKSTTFQELTIRIKQVYPNRWVSYIDLKDYIQLFTKVEHQEDVLSLLNAILNLKCMKKVEQKMFEELFSSGEVVLLWNGFDEVSPAYSDFIIHLLTTINRNTNNIQYISTRPLYSDLIRSKFGVTSHSLVPFDDDKQTEFLTSFFTSAKVETPSYIDKFNKIVDNLTWNSSSNFKTPLMLKMIADSITNGTDTIKSENIWDIYEEYVHNRIKSWKDSSGFSYSHHTDNEHFETLQMYQMYALKAQASTFPFRTSLMVKKLNIMTQWFPEELTSEEVARMELLYINGTENFKFSHKSFEEFFVAQFLVDNIYRGFYVEPSDAVLIIQLFIDIIKMYGTKQVMMIKFIHAFLNSKYSRKTRNFHPNLSKVLKQKFKFMFFELLIPQKDNSEEVGEFLFKLFRKDYQLLVDLIHAEDNVTLYTAAHGWEALKKLGEKYLYFYEFESFKSGRDQKGVELFRLYCLNHHGRVVTSDRYNLDADILQIKDTIQALDKIAQNLTKSEVQELFLSTSSPVTSDVLEIIKDEQFWEVADKFLDNSDLKRLISNLFCKISALNDFSNLISILFQKSEEILTDFEIFNIFLHKNILHSAAARKDSRIFGKFWTFFVTHTTEKQQKLILLREVDGVCFEGGQNCYQYPKFNIFHILLIFSNGLKWDTEDGLVNDAQQLVPCGSMKSIEIYEKYFEKSKLREILLKSNKFLPYFIDQNEDRNHEKFTNWIKNLFDDEKEKLKEFILRKIEPTGMNIFEVMSDKCYCLKTFSDLLDV
ncbi:hypothetical protein ACKWTF_014370 [Chironomus riparius]